MMSLEIAVAITIVVQVAVIFIVGAAEPSVEVIIMIVVVERLPLTVGARITAARRLLAATGGLLAAAGTLLAAAGTLLAARTLFAPFTIAASTTATTSSPRTAGTLVIPLARLARFDWRRTLLVEPDMLVV